MSLLHSSLEYLHGLPHKQDLVVGGGGASELTLHSTVCIPFREREVEYMKEPVHV